MTALAIDKPRGRAWWKELWIQVLIAMAAGIALGIASPEAGAKMQPLGDAFWGERYGQIVDPFGHRWGLAQHVRDVPREEVQRAATELFGG